MRSWEVGGLCGWSVTAGSDKETPRPSGLHPLPALPSRFSSVVDTGASIRDSCIFRTFPSIPHMLGVSSSYILHWKLPLTMRNCLTQSVAYSLRS